MQGNFRHRCVAGAFSLVTFFWAPKESDKTRGKEGMQNVKEKMRNLKVAAVHFWNVRCVEVPGDILFEWTTEIASEGSGISRWAVATLAGKERPHRMVFCEVVKRQLPVVSAP